MSWPYADEWAMFELTVHVSLLQLSVRDRTQLALGNIALRYQLAGYKRGVKPLKSRSGDRILWLAVTRCSRSGVRLWYSFNPRKWPCGTARAASGTGPGFQLEGWSFKTMGVIPLI